VSIREKITRNTSSTQLISLDKAYFQAVYEAENTDEIIAGKFQKIDTQIADLDERARAINLNYAECHEAILAAEKQAVLQLQECTKLKLEALLSVEVELRRQKEQLEWMDLFIKKQVEKVKNYESGPTLDKKTGSLAATTKAPLGAVEFLRTWK